MKDTISRLQELSEDCILRHVAGYDWLVRVKQDGAKYIQPVRLNDTGAAIWRAISEGKGEEELLSLLAEEGEPTDETFQDLAEFLSQLCTALDE